MSWARARSASSAALGFAIAVALAGCGDRPSLDDQECAPSAPELTYETFGEPFLVEHCQGCHASDSTDRNGAPTEFAFDTLSDVREHADRVFARAANDNTSMPPGNGGPSSRERQLLGEWLACGSP